MKDKYFIHPDIKQAETLPASFYRDLEVFEDIKQNVFLKSWQWIGDENLVTLPNYSVKNGSTQKTENYQTMNG